MRRWAGWCAAGLLAGYAALAWTASFQKGVSFDEGLQLAVGYNLWLNRDFRMEGANGDLIKRWTTLPYLLTRPRFVDHQDPTWQQSRAYDVGWRFFFQRGNRPEALLRAPRAMNTLLGVATGLLVFLWARELFGDVGGLVALTAFVLSPAMLAFGGIVSTDMSITLTLLGTTRAIWRLLQRLTVGRLGVSLVWTGLLVLAKPTALVIFPIAAVLVGVRLAFGPPLVAGWRTLEWCFSPRPARIAVIGGLVMLHGFAGWLALWAHYDFRYAASPEPANPALVMLVNASRDQVPLVFARTLQWMQRTHFLPEGFLHGIDALLTCDDYLAAFKNGEWKTGGWWTFFPYAIWVKTPPTLFILLALAGVAAWLRRQGGRIDPAMRREAGRMAYSTTPVVALVACYLAVAMTEDMNIGHRHVLPIYPPLYVLTGALALASARAGTWWRALGAAALGWLAIESFAIRPYYQAYFGPQAGGAKNGYRHLVDSSIGWGMNLPGLKQWLDVHNPGGQVPVFLAYFGNDNPGYYGLKTKSLPGFFDRRGAIRYGITPGYFVISASILQGVYTAAFGPWSNQYEQMYWEAARHGADYEAAASDPKRRAALLARGSPAYWENEYDRYENLRLARLCAWLRHGRPPDDHVGYDLLIWKLTEADLIAALLQAPVERVDAPATLLPSRTFVNASPQR